MPAYDGTGPLGMGAISGRGSGFCAGNRRGCSGNRRGVFCPGAGMRRGAATFSSKEEKSKFRSQLEGLQSQLDSLKKHLDETA